MMDEVVRACRARLVKVKARTAHPTADILMLGTGYFRSVYGLFLRGDNAQLNTKCLSKIIAGAKPIYRILICRRRLFNDQLVKDIFQSVKIAVIKSLIHRCENITMCIEILVSHLLSSCLAD